jgi:hypothetical protein
MADLLVDSEGRLEMAAIVGGRYAHATHEGAAQDLGAVKATTAGDLGHRLLRLSEAPARRLDPDVIDEAGR